LEVVALNFESLDEEQFVNYKIAARVLDIATPGSTFLDDMD
jgi:hypothetical protein